jgi:hypothetical protein
MKKLIIALGLVSILLFAWVVPVSASDFPGANWARYFTYTLGADAVSAKLIAGQTIDIGTVEVSSDSNNLYVTYYTYGGWVINETHLGIAKTLEGIPQNGGGPKKDDFLKLTEPPFSYTISLSNLDAEPGNTLFIVAHASVNLGNQQETAFGDFPPIMVVKSVGKDSNGPWDDANSAPGIPVTVGSPVYFQFVITNNSGETLTGVTLTDSIYSSNPNFVPSPTNPMLSGSTYTYVYGPVNAVAGQHTNIATATGKTPNGSTVTDTDPANYNAENISTPVPELPAAALFGIGLAGIGAFIIIRRRRSTASTR